VRLRQKVGALDLARGDLRAPIVLEGTSGANPVERETLLGVAIPVDADELRIFELLPPVFDLLSVMDEWTAPTALVATPRLNGLVQESFSASGLIEVHQSESALSGSFRRSRAA
jgi:hypothetical protein